MKRAIINHGKRTYINHGQASINHGERLVVIFEAVDINHREGAIIKSPRRGYHEITRGGSISITGERVSACGRYEEIHMFSTDQFAGWWADFCLRWWVDGCLSAIA